MRKAATLVVSMGFVVGWMNAAAYAQKGVGDTAGIVRQGVRPEIVTLRGKLVEIKTGPCESTTGPSLVGTHIFLETAGGKKLNVHFGPAAAVAGTVKRLSVGQQMTVAAFRTEKMKKDHYVARSVTFGKTTVQLRDETLRPVWAGGRAGQRGIAAGQGQGGQGRMGPRQGQGGRGRGAGRGGRRYRWRGGRGPGYGGGRGGW